MLKIKKGKCDVCGKETCVVELTYGEFDQNTFSACTECIHEYGNTEDVKGAYNYCDTVLFLFFAINYFKTINYYKLF